jgi:EAL domain-containing protein (putative c-di-GMP-specific phosphodiesterase class I)
MICDCRTDERRLAILADGLGRYPELVDFARLEGWAVRDDFEALDVRVGGRSRWSGVADVAGFLRAVLDPARFAALRVAWLDPGRPLEKQVVKLLAAEPLSEVASVDSSPLTELLRERRLETWYQPIFWAGTLEPWGYECLMRGRGPGGEVIAAPTLLEWARQEHLVFMLDRTARETHLRSAGAAGLPHGAHVLVNFLPTSIYRPEFCLATTVRAARESGLDPDRVVFEVVETERTEDQAHLREILSFYREKGFKVALDDVGSGWSGLSMLGDLNPDLLKIDRELVSKSASSPVHREICTALVRMGQANGQLVLAEGVETEEEWSTLAALGVNLFQGFLFGRPAPAPVARALVSADA